MKFQTQNISLNANVTFLSNLGISLEAKLKHLHITQINNVLADVRITILVRKVTYTIINSEGLFNSGTSVRSLYRLSQSLLLQSVEIQLALKSEFLPILDIESDTGFKIDIIASRLLYLFIQEHLQPLLLPDNWFLLTAAKEGESDSVILRTIWFYFNLTNLLFSVPPKLEMQSAILNFLSPQHEQNFRFKIQKEIRELLSKITDSCLQTLGDSIAQIPQESESFHLSQEGEENFYEILNFFRKENFSFQQVSRRPILEIIFEGENGTWTCYAILREQKEQFVFYSIYPIKVPNENQIKIIEFLTRANSSMIIGNFEFDFEKKRISFKTSIDVSNDKLSFHLIKNMIYTNLFMMDEYFLGITSILNNGISPRDAIAEIESS